jgi:hypothetical protein
MSAAAAGRRWCAQQRGVRNTRTGRPHCSHQQLFCARRASRGPSFPLHGPLIVLHSNKILLRSCKQFVSNAIVHFFFFWKKYYISTVTSHGDVLACINVVRSLNSTHWLAKFYHVIKIHKWPTSGRDVLISSFYTHGTCGDILVFTNSYF